MILLGMVKTEKTFESFIASNTVSQLKACLDDCENLMRDINLIKCLTFKNLLIVRYSQIKAELASR